MFKTLSKIIQGSSLDEINTEERKKYNSFMMCRYLSGNSKALKVANLINFNYKMPDNCQTIIISKFCKNHNIKYIKYPKYSIEKINVENIMKKYKINYEKALEYHILQEKMQNNI